MSKKFRFNRYQAKNSGHLLSAIRKLFNAFVIASDTFTTIIIVKFRGLFGYLKKDFIENIGIFAKI